MQTDVVIVGAGPAGLAAAAALTQRGHDVVVVDERTGPGGRYTGGVGPGTPNDAAWLVPPLGDAKQRRSDVDRLRDEARAATFLFDAFAWGLFDGPTLAVTKDGASFRIDARHVILATGRYVVRTPFPGHELDGVHTPAELARALDNGLLGGDASIAVIDEGLLADDVIGELRRRGIQRVTLISKSPRPSSVPLHVVVADPTLRRLGARYAASLELADGSKTELDVDALVVTGPTTPASELAAMVGCRHHFAGYRTGFVPTHGADGMTSVDRIHVAGSMTGTSNFGASEASGRHAAHAIAARLDPTQGRDDAPSPTTIHPTTDVPEALPDAIMHVDADSSEIACRCLGTTFARIADSVRMGSRSLDDVKREAKAGMGTCQGRDCQRAVLRLLEDVGRVDLATLQPMRVRAPIRPMTAGAMFEREGEPR